MSEEDRAAFDEGWTKAWEQHTELWNSETEKAIAGAEEGGATFEEVDSEAFVEALTRSRSSTTPSAPARNRQPEQQHEGADGR